VCICTYRRPRIVQTLISISRQRLPPDTTVRVVVADNDHLPDARSMIEDAASELGLVLTYVHAPAHNISIARNACLDAASAPLVAFIDDDEIATPDWIAHLLARYREGDCDVVFGPVEPVYAKSAPLWMQRAKPHAIRPVIRNGGQIDTGYTSNVLMRADVIGANRFDLALGRCGGEDTVFFNALHRQGAQLAYCALATVSEDVPDARTRLIWLLRRQFRSGQSHARLQRGGRWPRYQAIMLASLKLMACIAWIVPQLPVPGGWRRPVLRGALHAGVVAKLLGAHDLELYR
jgi:succinoglycan biosynthesis protein ExoM